MSWFHPLILVLHFGLTSRNIYHEHHVMAKKKTFGLLEQIQEFMNQQKCDPEQFKGRIIFMSMFNDII